MKSVVDCAYDYGVVLSLTNTTPPTSLLGVWYYFLIPLGWANVSEKE